MKKETFASFVTVFFLLGSIVQAADVTFDSSGYITDGDVFDNVYVRNNGTIVDMSGGQVSDLFTYDISTFNISDGYITHYIDIGILSTINISGGTIDLLADFVLRGVGRIYGGNVSSSYSLKAYTDSTLEILGGISNFNNVDVMQGADLTIKGGSLHVNYSLIDYYSSDPATVNLYGYGFNYDPHGGTSGEGILTGHLLDDNIFTFDGLNEFEYSRFNLIPEPASLCLLALGGLFLRRRP